MNGLIKFRDRTLAARLDSTQVAEILAFKAYEIPILVKLHLLKPLGKPSQNSRRWFATAEIEKLVVDVDWLNRSTRAIAEHFRKKSARAKENKNAPATSVA